MLSSKLVAERDLTSIVQKLLHFQHTKKELKLIHSQPLLFFLRQSTMLNLQEI